MNTDINMAGSLEEPPNPFDIFAIEIWDLILDELTDDNDTQNLLQAHPHLTSLFHRRHFSRRICEIMSMILPKYFKFKDALTCRLVSKRWKTAVELTIEMNLGIRPYESQMLDRKREHVRARALSHFHTPPIIMTRCGKFIESGMDKVSVKNPFPSRFLKIEIQLGRNNEEIEWPIEDQPEVNDLKEALPVIEKFGHQLSHICIYARGENCDYEDFKNNFLEPLFSYLTHLPNLKSLELLLPPYFELPGMQPSSQQLSKILPNLPRLETIDLSEFHVVGRQGNDIHACIMKSIASHAQVKKLAIDVENWCADFGGMFPKLVELSLVTHYAQLPCQMVKKVLKELRSPDLRKFRVTMEELPMLNLLKVLAQYPIESLEIRGDFVDDEKFESEEEEAEGQFVAEESLTIPTVKELRVMMDAGRCATYDFLRFLPSLHFLTFEIDRNTWTAPNATIYEDGKSRIGMALVRLGRDRRYDSQNFECVWEELPSLEMLTVTKSGNSSITRMYFRDGGNEVFTSSCIRQAFEY